MEHVVNATFKLIEPRDDNGNAVPIKVIVEPPFRYSKPMVTDVIVDHKRAFLFSIRRDGVMIYDIASPETHFRILGLNAFIMRISRTPLRSVVKTRIAYDDENGILYVFQIGQESMTTTPFAISRDLPTRTVFMKLDSTTTLKSSLEHYIQICATNSKYAIDRGGEFFFAIVENDDHPYKKKSVWVLDRNFNKKKEYETDSPYIHGISFSHTRQSIYILQVKQNLPQEDRLWLCKSYHSQMSLNDDTIADVSVSKYLPIPKVARDLHYKMTVSDDVALVFTNVMCHSTRHHATYIHNLDLKFVTRVDHVQPFMYVFPVQMNPSHLLLVNPVSDLIFRANLVRTVKIPTLRRLCIYVLSFNRKKLPEYLLTSPDGKLY